jgi:hypothetical protein
LSRVKSSGGAAYFLSGAGLIACKDVGRFAAFSESMEMLGIIDELR